ncbi:MAG: hypothetical protein IT450_04705 [Phycisphaerales bacterium]|nr:hypothetical protein [Phycisphaerales bacterium]
MMPNTLKAVAIVACSLCAAARGQVTWSTDEQASIRRATKEDRLLIFFFTSDEERREKQEGNRVDRTREDMRRAFSNPRIAPLVNRAFVPVAADFKTNAALKQRLGGRITPNDVIIARPDLTVLGRIEAGRQATVENIRAALQKALDAWISQAYNETVKPVLRDPAAKPGAQKKALNMARKMSLDSSDADVIALLDHPKLDGSVRILAYAALADLSTESAAKRLVKDATEFKDAEKALRRCDPAALPAIVEFLSDPAKPEFPIAYRAVVAITRSVGKDDGFWKSATDAERAKEVERIKEIAARQK